MSSEHSRRAFYAHNKWWRDLCWFVINERAGAVCERCHVRPAVQVHHVCYPVGRREEARDLMGVCDTCHCWLHFGPDPANNNEPPLALELSKRIVKF
jgi:hypothetical protein